MSDRYDAVVVGAGHNGLVAAVLLAREGWSVLVVERADRIGGAVVSAEITRPGFVSDVFSTNQNTFRFGPVHALLGPDLARHGLRYVTSHEPYASAFPDGTSLRVSADVDATLARLGEHDPRDADGWCELDALFQRWSGTLLQLYGTVLSPRPLARWLAGAIRDLHPSGLLNLAQLLLCSTRELGDLYLSSPEAKALLAAWGMHLDFGPDVSGGAMLAFVEGVGDVRSGMSLAEGGAGHLPRALAGLLRERNGGIRTGADVVRVITDGGRAVGVELADGERIAARRAVVAGVTPTALYGRLLADATVPGGVRAAARRYRYGPGTMMVHLALDGPVPWRDPDLGRSAYVHLAPYTDDLADAYTAACNGRLPADPLLVVGQTSVVDPTRAPAGKHVLWVQVRALPWQVRGDAAGQLPPTSWYNLAEPYADRILAKLERYAPGIGALVLDRAVLSPADLQSADVNLVHGDSISGSHHLRQNFIFRPLPGWSRYRTPVRDLYLTGASTWPGAGVTGLPGMLAAQTVLQPHPARRLAGPAALGAGVAVAAALARRARGR